MCLYSSNLVFYLLPFCHVYVAEPKQMNLQDQLALHVQQQQPNQGGQPGSLGDVNSNVGDGDKVGVTIFAPSLLSLICTQRVT